MLKNFLSIMQIFLTDNEMSKILSDSKNIVPNKNFYNFCMNSLRNIRNEIKKDTWSVCFSENGFNETLWLKYADKHKGFVLSYDTQNADNFLCGKQEKCSPCKAAKYKTPLYPIYYSNEKYDATKFAQYITICKMQEQFTIQAAQKVKKKYNGNRLINRKE